MLHSVWDVGGCRRVRVEQRGGGVLTLLAVGAFAALALAFVRAGAGAT